MSTRERKLITRVLEKNKDKFKIAEKRKDSIYFKVVCKLCKSNVKKIFNKKINKEIKYLIVSGNYLKYVGTIKKVSLIEE